MYDEEFCWDDCTRNLRLEEMVGNGSSWHLLQCTRLIYIPADACCVLAAVTLAPELKSINHWSQ